MPFASLFAPLHPQPPRDHRNPLREAAPGHCVAQDKRLPLHYAAKKGATLEVVELLLGPESNAATAAAVDKVRSSDQ